MKLDNSVNSYAKWTLILGAILIFILPFSVSFLNLEVLGEYGPVGDTIGGITSPVSQLLGSILIYLALKAQLDANTIIQNQVNEDNKQSLIRHDLEQIHELYSFFQNNIKSFSYDKDFSGRSSLIFGKRAIKHFFQDIEDMNVNIHNDDDILKIDGVREILGIINSAKLILQKNKNSKLAKEDKEFYNTLIYHELVFSIFPAKEIENEDPLALKKCTICEIYHGNFPPLIFHKIQELKKNFNTKKYKMIDKKELKKFLIENETHTIENTEEKLLDFVKGTMLNRNDVIDQDDQSHHRQEERLRKQLDKQVHDHHHHLEEIEALNFNPSQVVEPGAVIKVNDNYMVIATADGNFTFEGKNFISISTKAPIYQCMMGKKKGDVCSFNNNDFKIEEIY